MVFEKVEEMRAAFFAGRCERLHDDSPSLHRSLAGNVPPPARQRTSSSLAEIISKEPLGPVVRHGDNQFADIVRWAHTP